MSLVFSGNGFNESSRMRMAGDYLSEFASRNSNDERQLMFGNANRPTKANANKSNPQPQASTPVTSSSAQASTPVASGGSQGSVNNNNTAVLPKDMQQDMIDRGGTINADGSYEVGSAFESRWEKRHSPENLAAQKKAQEDLFAHAGVSSREEYFASDRHKASRSRAQSDTQRLKEKQARLGYS